MTTPAHATTDEKLVLLLEKAISDQRHRVTLAGSSVAAAELYAVTVAFNAAQQVLRAITQDDRNRIDLRITSTAVPLEIRGTIGGRPVYYRARSTRWELYEGRPEDFTGVDAQDHLTGPGVRHLHTGTCYGGEDMSGLFAVKRIMERCGLWIGVEL